ncbi:hypothetical protein KC19_N036200 [Ceratodon purpureus]|nr:hypothetical protein KC19_N036200 [Ceratodon purpureus]
MNLSFLSINVRGLNDLATIHRLRIYISRLNPTPDVVLIQEHNLTGSKAVGLGRQLLPGTGYFFREAAPGYGHGASDGGAGCGGVATLISCRLAQYASNSGSLFRGRALWVTLANLPGGDFGILNIYASNDARERTQFWSRLLDGTPKLDRWLLGGDFNMVESPADKSSACGRLISA